jgi:hypothetical protein
MLANAPSVAWAHARESTAGGSAGSAVAAKTCARGFKHAVIAGKHKCLRRGQLCSRKYRSHYKSRGFRCVARGAHSRLCRQGQGDGFNNGEWVIEKLGASIPEDPFEARIDGASIGSTRLLTFASRAPGTSRFPQVLVIAASGFLRMKAGADPAQPLPFGQSLVLGPAVFGRSTSFPNATVLFFNPQIQTVEVDTCELRRKGTGRLRIRLTANDQDLPANSTKTNQIMNLTWDVGLDEPTNERTRIRVTGRYAFTEEVSPDPTRSAEFQSFRLFQISSMFIDAARHDVDAFRYRDSNGLVQVALDPASANTLLPATTTSLDPATPILDSLHTDDLGQPNGNTPSYRITTESTAGPVSGPLTPRGIFSASQDLNDDNFGLWVYQQPLSVIPKGATGTIRYTVVATTDPLSAF